MAFQTTLVRRTCLQRDNQHGQVSQIAGQVIPEERVIRNLQEPNHDRNADFAGSNSASTVSSASSTPVRRIFHSLVFSALFPAVQASSSSSSLPRKLAFSSAVK